ncbi:MAG TPA: SLATT domain-containing protein [Tepidisphaeraceae bacterium]|nr:SLATT domain-containing protein [Tepidisphaeraceae bacterium]
MSNEIVVREFPKAIKFGTDDEARVSLAELKSYASAEAVQAQLWYMRNRRTKSVVGRGLRIAAILLTTIGGIVPFITTTGLVDPSAKNDWSQVGYVFLGLAAGSIALDRFFGFSSGWIRYMTTALLLQRLITEFEMDWIALNAHLSTDQHEPDKRELLLRRIQVFLIRVREEVERETAEWAAEYRSNLTELEKSTKTELETWRPAVINLTISNSKLLENVQVYLDDRLFKDRAGAVAQLTPVYPGSHLVTVKADTLDGKQVKATAAVLVSPGQVLSLAIEPS